MKRSNCLCLFASWLIVLLLCGCKPKANTPKDARLKDNMYTNRFFGFQVQLPNTWKILNKPSRRELRKGSEIVFGGDKELTDAAVQAGFDPLLMALDLSSGRTLAIAAEPLSDHPEIRTGADFLEGVLELATGPGKPLQKVSSISLARLPTGDFHRVDLAGNVGGAHQCVGLLVSIEKGHALSIMISAKSSEEVSDVLNKVGLNGGAGAPSVAAAALKDTGGKTSPSGWSHWFNDIRLQGVGGTEARRFAIINGKTLAAGEAATIKTSKKDVVVRCVAVSNASVTVSIEGLKGERQLFLN